MQEFRVKFNLKGSGSCVACRCSRTRRAPHDFPRQAFIPLLGRRRSLRRANIIDPHPRWENSQPFLVVLLILFSSRIFALLLKAIKHEARNFRFFFLLNFGRILFCVVFALPPSGAGDCFVVAVLFFRLFYCCSVVFPFLHLRSDTTKNVN